MLVMAKRLSFSTVPVRSRLPPTGWLEPYCGRRGLHAQNLTPSERVVTHVG